MSYVSLCAVQSKHDHSTYLRRITDYHEDYDEKLSLQWLPNSGEWRKNFDPSDPPTLYHPHIDKMLQDMPRDFVAVEWEPNKDDPYHPKVYVSRPALTISHIDPQSLTPLYNVIDSGASSLEDLQSKLMRGIPVLERCLSPLVLVLYQHDALRETFNAVLLRSTHLTVKGGIATLQMLSFTQDLTADRYIIDHRDIAAIPVNGHTSYLYKQPRLPKSNSKVPVYPFSQYVGDYVKWYCKQNDFRVSKSDRSDLVDILNLAMEQPDDLRQYAGTLTNRDQYEHARQALLAMQREQNPKMAEFLRIVLSEDQQLRASCLAELRNNAPEMKEIQAQLQAWQDEIGELEKRRNALQHEIDQAGHVKDEIDRQTRAMDERLDTLQHEFDVKRKEQAQALQELEQDAALRLGLHIVAGNMVSAHQNAPATPNPNIAAYALQMDKPNRGNDPLAALANNLRRLGVKSLVDTTKEVRALAFNLLTTLQYTRILAIDSSFSTMVANALSVATYGKPASHIAVPVDWHDVTSLLNTCEEQDIHVVVLDNVLDTANESMLFSLCRLDPGITVILPAGSRRTLGLLATELWDRIFYVPTDNFLCVPRKSVKKLQYSDTPWDYEAATPDSGTLTQERSKSGGVSAQSLMLPICVGQDIDEHGDDNNVDLDYCAAWAVPQRILQRRAVQSPASIATWLAEQGWTDGTVFLRTITGISQD